MSVDSASYMFFAIVSLLPLRCPFLLIMDPENDDAAGIVCALGGVL